MYGRCQAERPCRDRATHMVRFRNQPNDPMYVCADHAEKYRREGHHVHEIV